MKIRTVAEIEAEIARVTASWDQCYNMARPTILKALESELAKARKKEERPKVTNAIEAKAA